MAVDLDVYGLPRGAPPLKDNAAQPSVSVAQAPPAFVSEPVSILDFASAALAEPRWAVEGVWPEGASGVIAGRPKDGKSTLAVELAVSLWSGTPMFGNAAFPVRTPPACVLYVQQENSTARVQRDFQTILAARGLGAIEHEEVDGEVFSTYEAEPGDGDRGVGYHFLLRGIEEPPPFKVWSQPGFDLSQREHREHLRAYVLERGFRYVFLDPLYMLVGRAKVTDGGDELRPMLSWLTALRNETGAAVVLTHHMSDKADASNEPASMLGTTFIHGWYESALLTRRGEDSVFSVKVDALRDMGYQRTLTLRGCGVGHWYFTPGAQEATDSAGREAPRVSGKETKKAQLADVLAAHPEYSYDQLAEATGLKRSTVGRYVKELRADEDAG